MENKYEKMVLGSIEVCMPLLPIETRIELWNDNVDAEDRIFINNDDFFTKFFPSTIEAIKAVKIGCYNPNDKYVWFRGNGGIMSTSDDDVIPFDYKKMAKWWFNLFASVSTPPMSLFIF